MTADSILHVLLALLPVVCFLVGLVLLDSYKLVGIGWVLGVILAGGTVALLSYGIDSSVLSLLSMDFMHFSRYVAPLVEELLKALIIVGLLRLHRIGFLVDAAIFGFAAGAGFALVENLFFLQVLSDASPGVWIVRGFGTAIMHGGATAMFAVAGRALMSRLKRPVIVALLPGLAAAYLLHSMFNHFFVSPLLSTFVVLIVLPLMLSFVFQQSEKAVEEWLDIGFDADTELLELIHSGEFSESHVGQYLHSLKENFEGPVVADLLCYLRLHVELALRAKGQLMMRESGFRNSPGTETRAKLDELKYLEGSIGMTGILAVRPFLQMSRKDLWQFYVLGR